MVTMPTIHDVWLNWVPGNTKSYNIPEFYEWKKSDGIEMEDAVPIFLVTTELFNHIEDGECKLPVGLVKKAREKMYSQTADELYVIVMVITDGERVIAVKVLKGDQDILRYKSKLTTVHQGIVLRRVENKPSLFDKFDLLDSMKKEDELEQKHPLSKLVTIKPEQMVGLTRKEKRLKEILMDCLFSLGCSENRKELEYWFIELYPKMYGDKRLGEMTNNDIVLEMYEMLKLGWSELHKEFGNNLVKYYDTFKDIWEETIKSENLVKK